MTDNQEHNATPVPGSDPSARALLESYGLGLDEGSLSGEVVLYADRNHDALHVGFGQWLDRVAGSGAYLFMESGDWPENRQKYGVPTQPLYAVASSEDVALHAVAGMIMHRTETVRAILPKQLDPYMLWLRKTAWTESPETNDLEDIISEITRAEPTISLRVLQLVRSYWRLERATWKIVFERRNDVAFEKMMGAFEAGAEMAGLILGDGHYYDGTGRPTSLLQRIAQAGLAYAIVSSRMVKSSGKVYGGDLSEYDRVTMKQTWKCAPGFREFALIKPDPV